MENKAEEVLNIPLFRAKRIDSDKYVEGYFWHHKNKDGEEYCIDDIPNDEMITTDPTTLAIHFPDMIASDSDRLLPNGEKDLRIFASLREDGKGGDILEYNHFNDNCIWVNGKNTVKYLKREIVVSAKYEKDKNINTFLKEYGKEKAVGIQK